jgi:hypothetical protein
LMRLFDCRQLKCLRLHVIPPMLQEPNHGHPTDDHHDAQHPSW